MINTQKNMLIAAGFALALSAAQVVSAAVIVDSLGNTSSGLIDGGTPGAVATSAAQSGQPVPFNASLGSDLFSNASGSWSHNYGAISGTIIGATLDFGIVEHDSAAAGDQVALFTIDGIDLTSDINALFNGSGGGDGEYNIYQLDLSSLLGDLSDGSASIVLNLAGSGLQTCLIVLPGCDPQNPVSETSFNGANYIFSTLTIETSNGGGVVAEPGSLMLAGLGLLTMGAIRQRRIKKIGN